MLNKQNLQHHQQRHQHCTTDKTYNLKIHSMQKHHQNRKLQHQPLQKPKDKMVTLYFEVLNKEKHKSHYNQNVHRNKLNHQHRAIKSRSYPLPQHSANQNQVTYKLPYMNQHQLKHPKTRSPQKEQPSKKCSQEQYSLPQQQMMC